MIINLGKSVLNPIIYCACGCEQTLLKYDKYKRSRKYIIGHHSKNRKPWNKGKTMNKKYKITMKKSWTINRKKEISDKRIGTKFTEEHKNNIKNKFKKGRTPWNKHKHHSEESKRKMSKTRKELYKNGYIHPMLGKPRSEITKQKIREARLKQVIPFRNSLPERKVQSILSVNGISYETHKSITGQPDIFIPEKNLCIFIDGDYWHCKPDKLKHKNCGNFIFHKNHKIITSKDVWEKDARITKKLKEQGYIILRFWESEIHKDLNGCFEMIKHS